MAKDGKAIALWAIGLALTFSARKGSAKSSAQSFRPTASGVDLNTNLSPHFKLGEFLRSTSVPEVRNYVPTQEELARLTILCQTVLEPLRTFVGAPIFISGGARPESVTNSKGQHFHEALQEAGYNPATHSDHALFAGCDVQLVKNGAPSPDKGAWIKAFNFLKSLPSVRQVGIYFDTVDDGTTIADHIHVSAVCPDLPRKETSFSYVQLDNKSVSEGVLV